MKRVFIPVLAGLLLILGKACMYQPDDLYYVNVIPGEEPSLTFTCNLDTLASTVNDSIYIEFTANVDYGRILEVDFIYMDTAIVYSNDTIADSFWFNPYYSDTTSTDSLAVNVFYSSNTGSLADVMGGEYYFFEDSWIIPLNDSVK